MIFWLVFIIIFFAFLTSILSATALIGLFFGFKFLIIIFDLSLITLPFHLLGLNALIGLIDNFLYHLPSDSIMLLSNTHVENRINLH